MHGASTGVSCLTKLKKGETCSKIKRRKIITARPHLLHEEIPAWVEGALSVHLLVKPPLEAAELARGDGLVQPRELPIGRLEDLARVHCAQAAARGGRGGVTEGTKRGRRGVTEGIFRSSLDTRKPQNPTKSEEYQGHLQGVAYST